MGMVSIIIPVLNESEALNSLLPALAAQKNAAFEVIAVDGGSTDGSEEVFLRLAPENSRWIKASRGRGSQMNAGAKAARGELLLFLHADSAPDGENFLSDSVTALRAALLGGGRAAGKWRVDHGLGEKSFAALFMGAKSALVRPEAYAGDQGLLIGEEFFQELGGFDEELPYLEDLKIAAKISGRGRFVLMPGKIFTSPRRFWAEGLFERQFLNALIRFALFCERREFLSQAPLIYKNQPETTKLALAPFLKTLANSDGGGKIRLWAQLRRFGSQNAWQYLLWRRCRAVFSAGGVGADLSSNLPEPGGALKFLAGVFTPLAFSFARFFPRLTLCAAQKIAPHRIENEK